jgi:hypothetical protein
MRHITEKWLVKSSAERINIDLTESLMNLVSSNFLCLWKNQKMSEHIDQCIIFCRWFQRSTVFSLKANGNENSEESGF